jgi:hypothetical protein
MPCNEFVFEKYKKNGYDNQRKVTQCGLLKTDVMTLFKLGITRRDDAQDSAGKVMASFRR